MVFLGVMIIKMLVLINWKGKYWNRFEKIENNCNFSSISRFMRGEKNERSPQLPPSSGGVGSSSCGSGSSSAPVYQRTQSNDSDYTSNSSNVGGNSSVGNAGGSANGGGQGGTQNSTKNTGRSSVDWLDCPFNQTLENTSNIIFSGSHNSNNINNNNNYNNNNNNNNHNNNS